MDIDQEFITKAIAIVSACGGALWALWRIFVRIVDKLEVSHERLGDRMVGALGGVQTSLQDQRDQIIELRAGGCARLNVPNGITDRKSGPLNR
jgi:hypothetical protein